MKKILLFIYLLIAVSSTVFSQGLGIGTTTPDASAILDVTHTAKGLLIPRMNITAINGISNPAKGLLVYDSLNNIVMVNVGTPTAPNWQEVGPYNHGWTLTGNNGINPANQFVGTVDNQPLHFRINNIQAGELHPGTGNIFWGIGAGQSNATGLNNIAIGAGALKFNTGSTSLVAVGDSALFNNGNNNTRPDSLGIANTAIGSKSLFANTTGYSNTASGDHSLVTNTIGFNNTGMGAGALRLNTSGSDNTATGMNALFSNTTGFVNTATGFAALFSNTSGSFNTALGEFSLHDNTTGFNNTTVGNFSLQFNTTGFQNTAVGVEALKNNVSNNNVGVGDQALFANTTGTENTAISNFALRNNTTGRDNIAAGLNALINSTTGSGNAAFGNFAGDLVTGGDDNTFVGNGANNATGLALSNSTALGSRASITASNQVRLGNTSITSIGGVVGYTTFSDGRFKTNVKNDVKGIDFIMKLQPVTYQLDIDAMNAKVKRIEKPDERSGTLSNENSKTIFSGFIAQQVEQAARDAGYEFSGVDKPKNQTDFYGLRYAEFVVPLVKAVQEQQVIIATLQKQVETAKAEIPMEIGKQQRAIDELKKIVAAQQAVNKQLVMRLQAVETLSNPNLTKNK